MSGQDGLAPVIPLFGDRSLASQDPGDRSPASAGAADDRQYTDADDAEVEVSAVPEVGWRTEWDEDPEELPVVRIDDTEAAVAERDRAERVLLKRLRTRSLSVREARAVVAQHDLDGETVDAVIRGFVRHGYLDDAALAEQLVHSGLDRKGQGRQVIAQTLAKRGISREVADAALAELPDDDADRALDFARTKARSMASLDRDTALRRLVGQLSRRGYGGSVAMTAARQALDENGSGGSGVRFR